MIEMSQRSWVLMGILIGFYGNWYFNLLTKLEDTQNITFELLWVVSAISLFAYCTEIIHPKPTVYRKIRLGFVLAIVHLITTYAIYTSASLSIFQFSGIVLWFLIALNEIRMHYK